MKKNGTSELDDDFEMQPEYDLRKMRIVKRGPGHEQKSDVKMVRVTLDPDIAAVFSNDQSVNEALRTLLRALTAVQTSQ
jgi:hypothetical protein